MNHTSYIELDKENLQHNINFVRSQLKPNCRYSAVVKGNAYGHGIEAIVPLMEECGIDHFSVFSAKEAQRVYRVSKPSTSIMIMGWVDAAAIEWAIQEEVSFYIFNFSRLEKTLETAKRLTKKAKIHLELETGMNRTGFEATALEKVIQLINSNREWLSIEGICSHLAGAESSINHERVNRQHEQFKKLVKIFEKNQIYASYKHLTCSAGVLNYPDAQYDLVRVGIATYGYWPSSEIRMNYSNKQPDVKDPLKAVLAWKSEVMSLKKVAKGEYIGYGKSYLTNRPTTLATVPIGYGYGFSRDLSNLGRVLINGFRVPVIGIVNMNMVQVDVTDLENIQENDEVVIIGTQGDLQISVSSFSDMSNSLNYELLTRLPGDIPRMVK